MNKKIKNATVKEYDNIKFKSMLEVSTYKTLIEYGFKPEYEKHTYVVWTGFIPNTVRDNRPLDSITYTPDFVFTYNNKTIIIECKGMANDVFPYKFKMFRKYLQTVYINDSFEIWEIFTKKQLLELINNLKK